MKFGGERLGAQENVSKCLQYRREVGSSRESFIAPQENLPIGVSETRTCLGRGSDMSGQPFWNPAWGLDMSGPGLSH
jgi:hypothetical protein